MATVRLAASTSSATWLSARQTKHARPANGREAHSSYGCVCSSSTAQPAIPGQIQAMAMNCVRHSEWRCKRSIRAKRVTWRHDSQHDDSVHPKVDLYPSFTGLELFPVPCA